MLKLYFSPFLNLFKCLFTILTLLVSCYLSILKVLIFIILKYLLKSGRINPPNWFFPKLVLANLSFYVVMAIPDLLDFYRYLETLFQFL